MAWQAMPQGDYARAYTYFEQRLTLSQATGVTFTAVQQGFHESRSKIGAEIIAAAATEGQVMTMDQVIACVCDQRTA